MVAIDRFDLYWNSYKLQYSFTHDEIAFCQMQSLRPNLTFATKLANSMIKLRTSTKLHNMSLMALIVLIGLFVLVSWNLSPLRSVLNWIFENPFAQNFGKSKFDDKANKILVEQFSSVLQLSLWKEFCNISIETKASDV